MISTLYDASPPEITLPIQTRPSCTKSCETGTVFGIMEEMAHIDLHGVQENQCSELQR